MLTQSTNQFTINTVNLDEEYTLLLSWQDLVIRALRNPKFSAVYLRLYISLIDTYPQLLAGERAEIEVWKVRSNAGEVKESSATRFFSDLQDIQALVYEPTYDKKTGMRRSFVTPLPDFDAPETFNTATSERKRRAKDAEAKRRSQFKNPHSLFPCTMCGSTNLEYDLQPLCLDCGHRDDPIKAVPQAAITIDAEIIEIEESFLDEPTQRLAAVPKTPVIVQTVLPTPAAPALGMHPRKIACPACRKKDEWQAVNTSYGTVMYVCRCTPLE